MAQPRITHHLTTMLDPDWEHDWEDEPAYYSEPEDEFSAALTAAERNPSMLRTQ